MDKAKRRSPRVPKENPHRYSENAIERLDVVTHMPPPFAYGENVRRLAYEIWMLKGNRNVTRTQRLLGEELVDDETGEVMPVPSVAALRKWAKEDHWAARADEDIKEVAPFLGERHLIRLFATTDGSLDTLSRIATMLDDTIDRGEKPDARLLQVVKDACVELLKLRGLGTAGAILAPQIPQTTQKTDLTRMTPEELSQHMRQLIVEEREATNAKRQRQR